MNSAMDMSSFLRARADHFPPSIDARGFLEFGAPRMHYESRDSWSGTVSCCLDWRAELSLSALDAAAGAPDVVVGSVDFLLLRLGYEPAAQVLALYGDQAEAFSELFDGEWLAPDLDENDTLTAGMPISVALLVLDATVDDTVEAGDLRAWAVSQVAYTMLPTTAGLLAMSSFAPPASEGRPARRLVSTDRVDPDWPRVGCISIPGHPQFFGQATAYTYLDDARASLDICREQTIRVPVV